MRKKLHSGVILLLAIACLPNATYGQLENQVVQNEPVVGVSFFQNGDEVEEEEVTFASLSKELEGLKEKIAEAADKESVGEISDKVKKLEKADGLLHHSHKSPKMQFFGRIHLDYWAFPDVDDTVFPLEGGNPQDRFNFRRLRIGIKGDLNDNMFYKYEGEFAGGEEPSYRDAILGFKNLPIFNKVIIGNHKRPYGYDHLNSSRYNIFIERPFIIEAFNQDSRRLGISSNGNTDDLKYNWRYGVWNQELTQIKDGYIGDHYQLEFAGRLAATPWYDESSGGRGYLHWAVAGSVATPDGTGPNNAARFRTRPEARSSNRWIDTGRIAGADISSLLALETVFNYGAFQFTGEFQSMNVDRAAGFGPNVQFHGGYFQAAYVLTGEHHPWNRQTGCIGRLKPFENFFSVRDCDGCVQRGWGAWEVAARYSYADLTDEDVIGGDSESLTLAMNWYFNPYARLQFNYIMGEVNPGANNAGFGDYDIAGMRIMVDF